MIYDSLWAYKLKKIYQGPVLLVKLRDFFKLKWLDNTYSI